MRSLILVAHFALYPILSLAQKCYSLFGLEVTADEVVPCKLDAVTSICCSTNRTRAPGMSHEGGNTADECLPNGLCQNRFTYEGKPDVTYWVEYCTDKDYKSGKCMDICADQRRDTGAAMITPCDGTNKSEKWCCGKSDACCWNPNKDSITFPQRFEGMINGTVASLALAGPTSTESLLGIGSTPTTSTTRTLISESSTPQSQSPSPLAQSVSTGLSTGLSTGAKAGIAVGAVAGVIALVGAVFFARKAMRWKKEAQRARETNAQTQPYAKIYPDKYYQAGFAPSELPSLAPAELAVPPAELGPIMMGRRM
jgi:hypothetical protein